MIICHRFVVSISIESNKPSSRVAFQTSRTKSELFKSNNKVPLTIFGVQLSCQPRVTVNSCFVHKAIKNL